MAKHIGIDYGTNQVGIAVSDDRGAVGFPRDTYRNDRMLVPRIRELVRAENASVIVIGESKDKDGKDNPVMAGARMLAEELQKDLAVAVLFEPEYYSSVEARKTGGTSFVDAEAASIILNRYLERHHGDIDR